MNPDDVIRPWLIGCGQPIGASEAHPYRWPDPSTRPEVPFFTYQPVSGEPDTKNGIVRKHELVAGTHDAVSSYQQHYTCHYKITLFNSPTGFMDLAGCAVGAKVEQEYLNIFQKNNASFKEVVRLEDETYWDDERVWYQHSMICAFNTWAVYEHTNINHVIDEVILDDPYGVD